MTAGEIRALAVQAGIGPGVTVLDLCCGIAGPGRFLTRELGCAYLGVDASASAVAIARERAGDLPCRFAVAQIPPLPAGPFDVVLLLETMLAFEDKDALVREIAERCGPAGGSPSRSRRGRRSRRPSGRRCPTPTRSGSPRSTRWSRPWSGPASSSRGRRTTAARIARRRRRWRDAFAADAEEIAAQIGRRALDELLAAHRLWIEWLDAGRVRKFALVAGCLDSSRAVRYP